MSFLDILTEKNFMNYVYMRTVPRVWVTVSGVDDIDYYKDIRSICLWLNSAIFFMLVFNVLTLRIVPMIILYYVVRDYYGIRRNRVDDYQRQLHYLLIRAVVMAIFSLPMSILLLLCALSRYVTTPTFVKKFCQHVNPDLRINGGVRVPRTFGFGKPVVSDPRVRQDNLCAWNAIFSNGYLAQRLYGTRRDGRMDPLFMKELADRGYISVWFDDGVYGSASAYCDVTVNGTHVTPGKGTNPQIILWPENLDDLGVVIPKPRPPRIDMSVDREKLRQDIEELRQWVHEDSPRGRICEAGIVAGLQELDILDELMSKQPMDKLSRLDISKIYLSNPEWCVYDNLRRYWITRNPLKGNEAISSTGTLCWTGYQFVKVDWCGDVPSNIATEDGKLAKASYLLVMNDLPYRRGTAYVRRALELMDSSHMCEVGLIEGVPACGKTHYICENSGPKDLITLPSREGAKEYQEANKFAKTNDSIVVNGWDGPAVETLWVDEGLLDHCGSLEMVIQMVKPVRVKVAGDRNQIPFICRVPGYTLVHTEYPWTGDVVYLTKSYKNPKVVCDILRPLYPNGYEHANDIHGSAHSYHISGPEAVRMGYSVYLTYTQGEKDTLSKVLKIGKIRTIHEVQGLRFERVALVRLKINDMDIYNSVSHNIVALSRAWRDFAYFSVKPNDMMNKWLGDGVGKPEKLQLSVDKFRGVPFQYKGGANTIMRPVIVKLANPLVDENYDLWCEKMSQVLPLETPTSLAFTIMKPKLHYRWKKNAPVMPTTAQLQSALDVMFHRPDEKIATGDRLIWPIKWPPGAKIDLSKVSKTPSLEPRPAIHPLLKTPQPPRAMNHPLDVAVAFDKRTIDPPRQKVDYAPERANKLVEGFMRQVDREKLKHLNLVIPYNCEELRKHWWSTRDGRRKLAIIGAEPLTINGSKYYCIVRSDHKPKLDNSHVDTVPPGQLVTAHHPFWTSLFAPIFQGVLVKLLACLKSNIVMNTRVTWEELHGIIDSRLSNVAFQSMELDISKYDKSQDSVMLEAQCRLFKEFGLDNTLIEMWKQFHELCLLTSPGYGVTYKVGYQRRSGDSLTWLGNTIVLIMVLAYLYPIEEAYLVLVGGDDNNCCFPISTNIRDQSTIAAEELNFELKVLCLKDSMYFSSRFIILTRYGWITVADPVKLIIRLGRSDLQGYDHLNAIHDAWKELHYFYLDPEVRTVIDEATVSRYNVVLSKQLKTVRCFIDAIAAITNDRTKMYQLYEGTDKEWALTLDPNERVGGSLYKTDEDIFTIL